MIDTRLIVAGTGCALAAALNWQGPLSEASARFQINTPQRIAAFLSQVGVESAGLTALVENLNYSAPGLLTTFPSYFDKDTAVAYARQPEKIANRAYANRLGNGDEASGDGWLFRGRGLLQITGRNRYSACAEALDLELLGNPDLLLRPLNAAMSAAWYFAAYGCNPFADTGDVRSITRLINGGLNGYTQRLAYYDSAMKVLRT